LLLRFRYPKPPPVVVVGLISIITLSFILSALFSPVFPIILPPETFTVISLYANIPDPPSLAVLPMISPPSTLSELEFDLPPHIYIAPPCLSTLLLRSSEFPLIITSEANAQIAPPFPPPTLPFKSRSSIAQFPEMVPDSITAFEFARQIPPPSPYFL